MENFKFNCSNYDRGIVTALSLGTAIITATTVDGSKTADCTVTVNNTVNNKKGYVKNTELQIDLSVRSVPNLSGTILGHLYNYDKVEILDSIADTSENVVWDKIMYNNNFGYISNAYVQLYTSPSDNVVNIARSITKQFEAATPNPIAGNFDGQGLSLAYLQWCIGQQTLQPVLNRMDREYNSEMKSIFGTNYSIIYNIVPILIVVAAFTL